VESRPGQPVETRGDIGFNAAGGGRGIEHFA
jgi:hypothetical protein